MSIPKYICRLKPIMSRKFGLHDVGALLVYQRKEELLGNAGSVIKSLPKRNQGISGRMSYGYDSRYFVEFNFGYNGSERFAQNERYGFSFYRRCMDAL